MNPFRNLPYLSKGLKLVKEMLLQELMYLIVVAKLRAALLKMLNLVETCILNLRRKTTLNSTALNISYKHTGSV
jgi:hypothetical protein